MYFASLAGTFSYFWFGWLALFLVIEGVALKVDKGKNLNGQQGGTFSGMIWRLTRQNRLVFVCFLFFYAVLGIHFFLFSGT